MSDEQTERARELYHDGPRIDANLKPVPTMIKPGTFSDGQLRMGTGSENIHHDERPAYDHPDAQRYRAELRGRLSANRPHDREPSKRK